MHHQYRTVVVNGGEHGKLITIPGDMKMSVPPWEQRTVHVGLGQTIVIEGVVFGEAFKVERTLSAFSSSGPWTGEWTQQ